MLADMSLFAKQRIESNFSHGYAQDLVLCGIKTPVSVPLRQKTDFESDMTLKKIDIINSVMRNVSFKPKKKGQQIFLFPEMDRIPLGKERATGIVNSLIEIVKATLIGGEDERISGFGKFQVRFRWARRGVHPRSGEMIILRSRRVVSFRASPKLRKKMNS